MKGKKKNLSTCKKYSVIFEIISTFVSVLILPGLQVPLPGVISAPSGNYFCLHSQTDAFSTDTEHSKQILTE